MRILQYVLILMSITVHAQREIDWTPRWQDNRTSVVYAKDGYVYARRCPSLEGVTSLKDCKSKEELKVVALDKLKKYLIETRFEYVKRYSKFPEIEEGRYLNVRQKPEEIPLIIKDIEELRQKLLENPSNANLKMRLEIRENNLRYAERSLTFKAYLSEQADKIVARIAEGGEIVSNRASIKEFADDVIYDLGFKIDFGNQMGGFPKEPPQCYVKYHSRDSWRGTVESIMVGDKVLVEKCYAVVSPSAKTSECEDKVREVVSKGLCEFDEPVFVPVEQENEASIHSSNRSSGKEVESGESDTESKAKKSVLEQ